MLLAESSWVWVSCPFVIVFSVCLGFGFGWVLNCFNILLMTRNGAPGNICTTRVRCYYFLSSKTRNIRNNPYSNHNKYKNLLDYSASLGSARSSAFRSEDMSERIDRPSSISGRGALAIPANHCCDEVPDDPIDMEAMEMDIALAVD